MNEPLRIHLSPLHAALAANHQQATGCGHNDAWAATLHQAVHRYRPELRPVREPVCVRRNLQRPIEYVWLKPGWENRG